LKNNTVVHAKQGQREQYQPIKSVLTSNSDIYSVLNGFLKLYQFDTFYLADLNAITGQGSHANLIENVLNDFPQITFWIDAGYQKARTLPSNYLPVLGTECFTEDNFFELTDFKKRFILSLDFDANGEKLGVKTLFTQPAWWSENVIVMTLNRVGGSQGAAIDLLKNFKRYCSKTNFIAAGGIRNFDDVKRLESIGIEKVLIASALHSGAITQVDILKL